MRLDDDKLEALRRWGQDLRLGGSQEHAAVGRAILMLIEEIERLRLELLRTREQLDRVDQDAVEPVEATLHGRVQEAIERDPESSPESQPELVEEASWDAESESARTTISPQSWIETLRRQK
jgi:hypothetical protein